MLIDNIFETFPDYEFGIYKMRSLVLEDAKDYLEYMKHPKVAAFVPETDLPTNFDQAQKEMLYWSSLFNKKLSIYWGIEDISKSKLIGTIGFNSFSILHSQAEISYDLSYNYWGKGIMSRSFKNIIDFARQIMKISKIFAYVVTDNERSIKLLQRFDFQQKDILYKNQNLHGVYKDRYLFELLLQSSNENIVD